MPQCGAMVKRYAAERRTHGVSGCALVAGALPICQPTKAGANRMTSLFQILMMILQIAQFIIFAHIIMSWLINFQVLNLRQPLVAQIWDGLNRTLEPVYSRVRSFLPQGLGIDFAPLIVLLVIYGLRIVLINNAALFY
jgi:YggT family protein